MATRELNAISLYTGAGGLDFGFEAAGFRTAAAVEVNPVACRTIRRNRPDWNLIERDIPRDQLGRDFLMSPDSSPARPMSSSAGRHASRSRNRPTG